MESKENEYVYTSEIIRKIDKVFLPIYAHHITDVIPTLPQKQGDSLVTSVILRGAYSTV